MMPPGRSGYTTIKTIEEVLRSKAGEMGTTRKEVPARLERLTQMGLFRHVTKTRGSAEVDTGELAFDNPVVASITSGMRRPEAPPRHERQPRAPRRGARPAAEATDTGDTGETETVSQPEEPAAQLETAIVKSEPTAEAERPVEPEGREDEVSFRWVSGVTEEPAPATGPEPAVEAPQKPKRAPRKPAARKTAATTKTRATKARTKKTANETAADTPSEGTATEPEAEPVPSGTEG